MTTPSIQPTEKRIDPLFPFLALFTVTYFVYRDFDIRTLYGFVALILVLGLHLVRRLVQDRPPVLDPLRLGLLALAAAVLVNVLRPDSRHNMDGLYYLIAMTICCGFVVLSRPNERTAKLTLGICFGGAVGIMAFVQFFEFNPWWFWNWFLMKLSYTAGAYLCNYVPKGYGFTLGGATFTDYVLFLGIAVCCGYLVSGRKFDWKSLLALVFGGVFLYSILIVGRRGELLVAVAVLALLVLFLCGKKQRRFLILGGIIALVVGFGILVALLPWMKQFPPLVRYVMTIEQILSGQDITSGRLELYSLAWNAFLENPIFGIGWDNFHTLVTEEFQALHGFTTVEDVHNIYLQFLTEAGILGTPLLLAPIAYIYYRACSQLLRLKKRPGELQTARMLCVTSFLIQSFLLILGLLDPTFQKLVFWCFYALAILMLLCALDLEGHVPEDPVSRALNKFIHFCAPPFVLVWNWVAGLFRPLRR